MVSSRALSRLGRQSLHLPKSCLTKSTQWQHFPTTLQARNMAAVIPPVMQDSTGSKGPTAIVFMNMGGPSTTDEVGDFLSRLFVSAPAPTRHHFLLDITSLPISKADIRRLLLGRRRPHSPRPSTILPRPAHLPPPYAQNPSPIRCHWRWLAHPALVRAASRANLRHTRQGLSVHGATQTICCLPLRRTVD